MYQQQTRFRFGGAMTSRIKQLIIIMVAIFLFQKILMLFSINAGEDFIKFFALSHQGLVGKLFIWQPFTYMFLHGGFFHIFFNCFALWMFGSDLERLWGEKRFTSYFLLSGLGAGLFIALMNAFLYGNTASGFYPTIGASGAIYAILLAYGMTWPNREVLLYFLFPIKMKYLLLVFGAIEFFGTLNMMKGVSGNISHIGHLGGLIAGYLLLRHYRGTSASKKRDKKSVSGYLKKRNLQKKKNLIEQRTKAKKIIDRMLDKIAKTGVESLTPEEKRDLEWARRHYYPQQDDTIH